MILFSMFIDLSWWSVAEYFNYIFIPFPLLAQNGIRTVQLKQINTNT